MDPMNVMSIGSLHRILSGEEVPNPIVQCVQVKPMNTQPGAPERWRVVFNDTQNYIQSMIAQQATGIVSDGTLKKGSICRLKSYNAQTVKEKLILVILDFEVLAEYGEFEKIGEPQALEATAKSDVQETKPQTSNISGSNFYGNKPQGQQQNNQPLPSRATGGAAGGVRESSHGNIYPIEALSPYAHKWTIKARCTFKSEIKTWHNKNGEGKLFSVNLLDASGEIRATGFNDAVDSWYEILEEGSVYYITAPCRVQPAKKQFSNVNNDYELTFERETQIEKADDNEGVPTVQYNFTSLGDLQNIEKDTTIDAIGVLQEVGEVSEIVSKTTSKPFSKRELTLVDNTGFSARLTIWGASAQSFNVEPQSVIAFKGLKVSDFGGRSLSLLSSGSMSIDPDIDEAAKLKGWYDAQGRNETYQTHASVMASTGGGGGGKDQTKTIAQVRDENLGMTENSDYFTLKATVVYIKQDNIAYPACLTEGCNKKVTNDDEGVWRCEKCNVTHPKPDYRYIMSVNVSDHTGMLWLSCFDDAGKLIMGRSANDIMAAKEEGEDTKVSEMFQQANCTTLIFRCRAKMDSFQDQQRVRYQVVNASPINYVQEAKKLVELIKSYSINDDNNSTSLFIN